MQPAGARVLAFPVAQTVGPPRPRSRKNARPVYPFGVSLYSVEAPVVGLISATRGDILVVRPTANRLQLAVVKNQPGFPVASSASCSLGDIERLIDGWSDSGAVAFFDWSPDRN